MEVTGPFTAAVGAELDVSPPNGASKFNRVILANASPMACQVNSGGVAQWLQPWSADVYPCEGGNPAQITPAFTTSATQTTGQITATWLLPGDPLNGTYPVGLFAQAVAANTPQTQLLTTTTYNLVNGTLTLPPLAVPAGIQSLIVQGSLVNPPSAPGTAVTIDGFFGPYHSDAILFSGTGITGYNFAVIDVLGATNPQLVLAAAAANQINLAIYGSGYPARQVRADRNVDTYWGPFTAHTTAPTAGTDGVLLANPPALLGWDIRHLEAHAVVGSTVAGDFIQLVGATSGAPWGLADQATPTTNIGPLAHRININEGLTLQNRLSAAGANATAYARLVPLAA